MILVVDANVLFSFFSQESIVRAIVVNPELELGLELTAPMLLLTEIDKHKSEICKKAGISQEEYKFPRNALEVFVKKVPNEFWQDCKAEASKLLKDHPKDIPYFALALKLKSAIWSNEKRFKRQSKVKVYTTSELLKELGL